METIVRLQDLDAFAQRFWQTFSKPHAFLFHGDLGAGKTTLISALCRAKGVQEAASSPTFSIINEYVYKEHGVFKKLYHIDLYRLESEEAVYGAGVENVLEIGTICFIEWPERAPYLFDENCVHIYLQTTGEKERCIRIDSPFTKTLAQN